MCYSYINYVVRIAKRRGLKCPTLKSIKTSQSAVDPRQVIISRPQHSHGTLNHRTLAGRPCFCGSGRVICLIPARAWRGLEPRDVTGIIIIFICMKLMRRPNLVRALLVRGSTRRSSADAGSQLVVSVGWLLQIIFSHHEDGFVLLLQNHLHSR